VRRARSAASARSGSQQPGSGTAAMVLVRLLLFLALATIAGAALFYMFTKDRRYLRFIAQVVKYTIFMLVGVMLFFVFERLVIML
jgi:hypothetical protein